MRNLDFVLRAIGAVSAICGLFLAGYWLGNRDAAQAERVAKEALGILVQTNLAGDAKTAADAALAAAERGDFEGASSSLSSNVFEVAQSDCYPTGTVFAVTAGALVRNCETGMIASIASINSNATFTATLGGERSSGNPGHAFRHPSEQFANCFLVYLNLAQDTEIPTARLNFDCSS